MKNAMLVLIGFSVVTSVLAVETYRADDWALGQWIGYVQNRKVDKSVCDIDARVFMVSQHRTERCAGRFHGRIEDSRINADDPG